MTAEQSVGEFALNLFGQGRGLRRADGRPERDGDLSVIKTELMNSLSTFFSAASKTLFIFAIKGEKCKS